LRSVCRPAIILHGLTQSPFVSADVHLECKAYTQKGGNCALLCPADHDATAQDADTEDEEDEYEESEDGFVVPNGYISEDEGLGSLQQSLNDLCADLEGVHTCSAHTSHIFLKMTDALWHTHTMWLT
jgi:hypothetical protein